MPTFYYIPESGSLVHHGTKGQKWGHRRYQNADGTWTEEGKARRRVGTREKRIQKSKQLLTEAKKDINEFIDNYNTKGSTYKRNKSVEIFNKVSKAMYLQPSKESDNLRSSNRKIAAGLALGATVGAIGVSLAMPIAAPAAAPIGAWYGGILGTIGSLPISKIQTNSKKFDETVDRSLRDIIKKESKNKASVNYNKIADEIIRNTDEVRRRQQRNNFNEQSRRFNQQSIDEANRFNFMVQQNNFNNTMNSNTFSMGTGMF